MIIHRISLIFCLVTDRLPIWFMGDLWLPSIFSFLANVLRELRIPLRNWCNTAVVKLTCIIKLEIWMDLVGQRIGHRVRVVVWTMVGRETDLESLNQMENNRREKGELPTCMNGSWICEDFVAVGAKINNCSRGSDN